MYELQHMKEISLFKIKIKIKRQVKVSLQRERERYIELDSSYTWCNSKQCYITNNLLLNSYFGNLTIGLHVLYIFNMLANFHANRILLTISFINTFFIYNFKLQKLEFKQLIDDIAIDI